MASPPDVRKPPALPLLLPLSSRVLSKAQGWSSATLVAVRSSQMFLLPSPTLPCSSSVQVPFTPGGGSTERGAENPAHIQEAQQPILRSCCCWGKFRCFPRLRLSSVEREKLTGSNKGAFEVLFARLIWFAKQHNTLTQGHLSLTSLFVFFHDFYLYWNSYSVSSGPLFKQLYVT